MIARLFIITQIVICILSLALPGFPGWKMFASVEPLTLALSDENHATIDPLSLTPYPPYGLNDKDLARIGEFRCRRDRQTTYLGEHRAEPPGCQLEK